MPTRTNNQPPPLVPSREVVDAAKAYAADNFHANHPALLINYNRVHGWNMASLANIACRVLALALDETERVLDAHHYYSNEHADYKNGVTGPEGYPDEGEVRYAEFHNDLGPYLLDSQVRIAQAHERMRQILGEVPDEPN